jgi:hypothetical protein
MIPSSPAAMPATASAATAKNKLSQARPFNAMSRCGSAIVVQAPMTTAQMKVTQLMNAESEIAIGSVRLVAA